VLRARGLSLLVASHVSRDGWKISATATE